MFMLLGDALQSVDAADAVTLYTRIVDKSVDDAIAHSACSRGFQSWWNNDKTLAKRIPAPAVLKLSQRIHVAVRCRIE